MREPIPIVDLPQPEASSAATSHRRTFRAMLWLTILNSFATGILWNGLGFITDSVYRFTETETYTLFIATGTAYTLTAFLTGSVLRRFASRLNARRAMQWIFIIQGAFAPLVYVGSSSTGLLAVAMVTSMTGAALWPVVESYIAAGRSADEVRKTLGIWCIAWMGSVTGVLLLMAPLQGGSGWFDPRLSVFSILPLSALSLWIIRSVPDHPEHHHAEPEAHDPRDRALLASARALLPASYLLVGALSPLMPYLLERMSVSAHSQTPLTATWLGLRTMTAAALSMLAFWHGRWGTLLLGAVLLAGGFALVVGVPSLFAITIGLALFGVGHGIIYYAAIYYALRVGNAAVDAGGVHEALIGLGYVLGPLAGLLGHLLGGGGWTVALLWTLLGLFAVPAMLPWWRERREHRKALQAR